MSLRRPIKVGKYDVIDVLGRGGMGVVYKATDPALGRSVAIKMMTVEDYSNNPEMLQRFYREAKSTGNLHHRNIVTVYELGDQDGSPYLVMEFLEGQTLDTFIRSRRPLTLLERIDFTVEICEGLTYAHERSVIHRDIKPGNIMVLTNGGVKLVDFGIAHIGNHTVTRTGQLLGSLPYMSPEQISGKQVDGRTDIFSLGAVFYQLLTWNLPFEGETPAATLMKIMHDQPRPLSEYHDSFPTELDGIVLRALAKNREQRYATPEEFAIDLLQIRGRIQQELVEEHLNEAESLLLQGELLKTRDKLSDVLKIDRYNTKAVELSRITQQHLEQQEVGQRVEELQRQAEEAYRHKDFVGSLELIQQALNLHSTDPDLQRLRANVQQAKIRAERLRRAIERAELARQQGELDSAKQAVEEALELSPDDAEVNSLNENIRREWSQRARRLQVENLIEEARREIASRNFTVALKVLRSAEAIDPEAPQLKELLDAAQTAREQERRRKAVEAAKLDIEAALDRDDFESACDKAQATLRDFPDDRGLQKLTELAEKQRTLAERKRFIDEHVAEARKLLEVGHTEEALRVLQSAQESIGGDPHVESLLGVVRETFERQRKETQKADYLRRAKDLLRRKEYADCIGVLEEAHSDLGDNTEINDLLQFAIDQSNAEKRRQIADATAKKAQTLIENQDYERAVALLEAALRDEPDEELRLVLVQARHAAADHRNRLQDALANADSMMQGQRPIEALKYLRSQPVSFARDSRFAELLEKVEQQVARLEKIERELEKSRVHLRRDEYDQARSVATECARMHGNTPELSKLLSEIEERQAQVAAEMIESAMSEARRLIITGTPEAALDHLALVQTKISMVPPKVSAAYAALRQEAANAKVRKSKSGVEHLLVEGEHEKASGILNIALAESPQSRELQQLKRSLDQAVQRRTEAQSQVSRAEEFFRRGCWREGAEVCLHAAPFSSRDPIIRRAVLATLEQAAATCVEASWREAELLLQCIKRVHPSAAVPPNVTERIKWAKREESILECLAEVNEFHAHGNLAQALERIEEELLSHHGDSRLVASKQTLQELCRQTEERTHRERKKQYYIKDVDQRLEGAETPDDRIRILEEALCAYPEDPNLTRELGKQRELWQTVTSLVDQANGYEQSRGYEKAIQSWQAIRELGVTHPNLESSLARLGLSKEERDREIQAEKEAREKQEKVADILEAAQILRSHGNFESSLRKIDEGLAMFPGHPHFVEMKAAVEVSILEAKKRKERSERQQQPENPLKARRREDEKRSQAPESRKTEGKYRSENKADRGLQQREQESKDLQVRRAESNPALSQISASKAGAQPDEDNTARVWRGSALPVEVSRPIPLPESRPQLRSESSKLETARVPGEAKTAAKRLRVYAALGASLVAAAVFGPMAWKGVRQPAVSTSTPVQAVATAPASSVANQVPTVVMVRLELRDGKPGAKVLVDNQPKGEVGRRGTFSIEVSPGDHQIQWTARNNLSGNVVRHFSAEGPLQLTAADLAPEKPSVSNPSLSSEQADWQHVKDSRAVPDLEQFIARYPQSAFRSEALKRLEDDYWNTAADTHSTVAYNQYIDKYPQGPHSQEARDNIAELEWRAVENSADWTSVDAFLKKHSSGVYHDKAVNKLDEVTWQNTRQNDASSLRSYLQDLPQGHHAEEASKRIEELSSRVTVTSTTKPAVTEPPPLEEEKAVLDVLVQYRRAYEGHDLQLLQEIWPGISAQQVKSLGEFFAHAKGVILDYRLVGTPILEADHATVTFQQSLQYVVNGKPGKDLATVTMHLKKSQTAPQTWQIDSVR